MPGSVDQHARDDATDALAVELTLTSEQIDDLFRAAAQVT